MSGVLRGGARRTRWGIAVVLIALAALLMSTTGAFAAYPPGVESGDDPKPTPKPKDPDPPCTANCGGNGTTPGDPEPEPEPPVTTHEWHDHSAVIDFRETKADAGWVASQAYVACGPSTKTRIGARVKYQRLYNIANDSYVEGTSGFRDPSAKCINLNVTDKNTSCVVSSTAYATKTTPGARTVLVNKTTNSAVGRKLARGEEPTIKQCEEASSYVELRVDPADHGFGKYLLEAWSTRVPVTITETYDPIAEETTREITKVGGPSTYYPTNPDTVRYTYTCDGITMGHKGKYSYTADDCGPDGVTPGEWTCQPADASKPAVTINGYDRAHYAAFRDGKPNELVWSRMRPRGNFKVEAGTSQTRFLRAGTPWRSELGDKVSVANAYVRFNTSKTNKQNQFKDEGTSWRSGGITKGYLRGYWSSQPGQPTEVTPEWRYEGTTQVQTKVLVGYRDGEWLWETKTRTVETTATCPGTPAYVEFLRSVTTG